ncbi:hypothetical protein [Desulfomonile tiedjei]|uniref:Glycosyltransferase RgtA/B/C/D-like domain-containing protein n=1 Tax=Desulfomonile tiedjei (strain ATCC 49306 / DSM 6799 / DCB-1) TaxID=706587 RepID=I4C1H9_DESTA|nr:hypothetical protein [Desulfomonile tiedjei]AFM23420.1 hypothetical protein Desti_0694 [Desulfomonile tiedjei DSM 6799]
MNIKPEEFVFSGFQIVLLLLFLVIAGQSITWPVVDDLAYLQYCGYLFAEHGLTPYKDFYDFQMPGTHLLFSALVWLVGVSALKWRLLDIALTSLLLTVTALWMRKKFNWQVALFGSQLVGFMYFSFGPNWSLQRDFIMLLPISLALVLLAAVKHKSLYRTCWCIGLLFGLSAAIKPQAAIGLPVVLFMAELEAREKDAYRKGSFLRLIYVSLSGFFGFLLPLALIFLWLYHTDAFYPFLDIWTKYLPCYNSLLGWDVCGSTYERIAFIAKNYVKFGGFAILIAPLTLSLYFTLFFSSAPRSQKRWSLFLTALAFVYSVNVAMAGKFFPYHWLPVFYFFVLVASLCIAALSQEMARSAKTFPIMVLLISSAILFRPSGFTLRPLIGHPVSIERDLVQMVRCLTTGGDTPHSVQVLAHNGTAHRAAILSKSISGSRFLTDTIFYVNEQSPTVQELRQRFLKEFLANKPEFILEGGCQVRSKTTDGFPALQRAIRENYSIVCEKDDFKVWRRSFCSR